MRKALFSMLLLLIVFAAGCATKSTSTEPTGGDTQSQPSATAYQETYDNPNYYYDF